MVLTSSFIHVLLAPLVPLTYPVPQGELTQLHLDVQHQVVPNLEDTQHASICHVSYSSFVSKYSLAYVRSNTMTNCGLKSPKGK